MLNAERIRMSFKRNVLLYIRISGYVCALSFCHATEYANWRRYRLADDKKNICARNFWLFCTAS